MQPVLPSKLVRSKRVVKISLLRLAKVLGLFRLCRRLTRNQVRILAYHGVWLGPDDFSGDALFIRPRTFEDRLDLIDRLGFKVRPLASVIAALRGGGPDRDSLVITIDDGWFGTKCSMLPALEARAMPATLYCDTARLARGAPVGHVMARYFSKIAAFNPSDLARDELLAVAFDRTLAPEENLAAACAFGERHGLDVARYKADRAFDYMTVDELREASSRGLDVQLHTHNHAMHDLSTAAVVAETVANAEALAAMLSKPVGSFRHFCYPSGVYGAEAVHALIELDIASATTTHPGLVRPSTLLHLLPRFLDGDNVHPIEFEAELNGLVPLARDAAASLRRVLRRGFRSPAPSVRP